MGIYEERPVGPKEEKHLYQVLLYYKTEDMDNYSKREVGIFTSRRLAEQVKLEMMELKDMGVFAEDSWCKVSCIPLNVVICPELDGLEIWPTMPLNIIHRVN